MTKNKRKKRDARAEARKQPQHHGHKMDIDPGRSAGRPPGDSNSQNLAAQTPTARETVLCLFQYVEGVDVAFLLVYDRDEASDYSIVESIVKSGRPPYKSYEFPALDGVLYQAPEGLEAKQYVVENGVPILRLVDQPSIAVKMHEVPTSVGWLDTGLESWGPDKRTALTRIVNEYFR